MSDAPRFVPAGDRSLFIEFEERIDSEVNRRAVALSDALRSAAIPGIQDIVPAYRSVGIHFDPLTTDYERLVESIRTEVARGSRATAASRTVVVPVCYGDECGPDLSDVARRAALSETDVIALHAGPIYRVFMLGFLPGFAYMGPLDSRLVLPRRATPRTRVPAGSVAIAGQQTGIYPGDAPGGWHVIGRTPLRPYDVSRAEPCLFTAGDAVRFVTMNRDEFSRAVETVVR